MIPLKNSNWRKRTAAQLQDALVNNNNEKKTTTEIWAFGEKVVLFIFF